MNIEKWRNFVSRQNKKKPIIVLQYFNFLSLRFLKGPGSITEINVDPIWEEDIKKLLARDGSVIVGKGGGSKSHNE